MEKFKLRAKTINDILVFLLHLRNRDIFDFNVIQKKDRPDVEFEFMSKKDIKYFIDKLKKFDNGQIMFLTLNTVDLYDGERNTDRL